MRHGYPQKWRRTSRFILSRGRYLVRHPLFLLLTLVGNAFMVLGAVAHFWLERGINAQVTSFLDSLWWSVSTVTTVGYGDVVPITPVGRVVGMGLMIFGTALFSAFTALFASVLLMPELEEIGHGVRDKGR